MSTSIGTALRFTRISGVLGALLVGLAGCGADPTAPGDPQQPSPPVAASPTGTATGTEVAPRILPPPDPCDGVAEPKSCCLGRERYGSLAGTDMTCGPNGNESCCKFDNLAGGTFNRMNNAATPATVPAFQLGSHLVTTARFKVFMEEGKALQNQSPPVSPAPGSGAHPTLGAATGWQAAWNPGGASCGGAGCLAKDDAELRIRVYKDAASIGWGCTLDHYPGHPRYPVNCVSVYEATAFCAWDGGYLPTEAMYEFAARGGEEQRPYAWGADAPTLGHSTHCAQGGGTWNVDLWCNNPAVPAPSDVGSATLGKGRYGTYDLMGNLMNILADEQGDLPTPCTADCVSRPAVDPNRVAIRGIAFIYPNNLEPTDYTNIVQGRAATLRKNFWSAAAGFRCAYPNGWVSK